MKVIDSVRRPLVRLWNAPQDELNRWARAARTWALIWYLCFRRLGRLNSGAMASALSFRTIFTMVPVILLAFLVLKAMGTLEDGKRLMREFLDQSGLRQIAYAGGPESATQPSQPATGATDEPLSIADQVESLVDKVEGKLTIGALGPIGAALMVWTAITLLTTIESSLNRVFDAPRRRTLARRVMLYWSALTLGPVVLVAAVYAGRTAGQAVEAVPWLAWATVAFEWVGPGIVSILLLGALYALMPNTPVRYPPALFGAAVVVPLWMLARWGFALYVNHVGKTSLYGALSLVPLFLMWLNLSWSIFLFGAGLAHAAMNVGQYRLEREASGVVLTQWHLLAAAAAVARGQALTGGPVGEREVGKTLLLPDLSVRWLVDRLVAAGFVCRVTERRETRCVLAKPAERIAAAEVLRIGAPAGKHGGKETVRVTEFVDDVRRRCESGIRDLTLADMTKTG